jgi:hypothetical protein
VKFLEVIGFEFDTHTTIKPQCAIGLTRERPMDYPSCMPQKKELLDLQFIEARHKLLDLAAFLDRIERAAGDDDFRIKALRGALPILLESRGDRAKAILEMLSDPSTGPIPKAVTQGAHGAPPPQGS